MNSLLSFTSFSELFFVIVFITALVILLYVFAKDMMNHNKSASLVSHVTHDEVAQYFTDKGYVVCNISQVKNENKWFGYLIKNGEYLLATAFTNGELVERHIDSLE